MSTQSDSPPGAEDLAMVVVVLIFGGMGYLCDTHSPLAIAIIPFFGAFFLAALIGLSGLCAFHSVAQRRKGWVAGLIFALLVLSLTMLIAIGFTPAFRR